MPRQIVEVDAPLVPIFTLTQLPQLTPDPPRLPAEIDADPDPTPTALDVAPAAAAPSQAGGPRPPASHRPLGTGSLRIAKPGGGGPDRGVRRVLSRDTWGFGRRKGTPNKATADAKAFARAILFDARYQDSLRQRTFTGKLPPAVEVLLFHFYFGVPRQPVEVEPPLVPIFTIARLPDLTPMPARLPSAIDVVPDDDETH